MQAFQRGFSFSSWINAIVKKLLLSLPNLVLIFQGLVTKLLDFCLKGFLLETVFVIVKVFNKLENNKSVISGRSNAP